MRRGQLSPMRIVFLAMLMLAVVVIVLLILRPNLVGFGEASNATVSQSFKGIQKVLP